MKQCLFMLALLLGTTAAWAQTALLRGQVRDQQNKPLPFAGITAGGTRAQSDSSGRFRLNLKAGAYTVIVSYVGHDPVSKEIKLEAGDELRMDFQLVSDYIESREVELVARNYKRQEAGIIVLDPKPFKFLPTPTGDFSRILATLPGVVANNELSSAYSVRGGSYDENLVYVNDVEIYRPFLVRAGQQEGLSFVNPDLVQGVEFSTGGWQPRFGDKLSSVLNVTYKVPTKNAGSATLGLLYQAAHAEVVSPNKRLSLVAGIRNKTTQYLLQRNFLFKGLDVQGEYLPRFTDFQSYVNYNLTSRADSLAGRAMSIGVLGSFARNRYLIRPTTRETDFGTISAKLRLYVAFDGQEQMYYDTWQAGLRFSRTFSKAFRSDVTFSGVRTAEREKIDVEGGYRLSQVQTDATKDDFNQSIFNLGVGTNYHYGRNDLDATIYNLLNRNYWKLSERSRMEFGVGAAAERIVDNLYEYQFVDSADYVRITDFSQALNTLQSYRASGYWQHSYNLSRRSVLTWGGRLAYWTFNKQLFASPRIQYSIELDSAGDWMLKFAAGVYHQSPFYREMRRNDGTLNEDIRTQRSLHFIAGSDYAFRMWGRGFRFTSELYYKAIDRIIPYDVDNVRLRYYAVNGGHAYATGADFRVAGEFIKGAESWFSLGLMQTKEDLSFDRQGYVRRPTDQRITLGIFFQDHLPNNPSVRAYLNTIIGTGLPFGPPRNLENRAALSGPMYRRIDVGFSKVLSVDGDGKVGRYFDSIWLGAEILNVLGAANTISYTWISDVNSNQFAIPNTLSQRFVNIKAIFNF